MSGTPGTLGTDDFTGSTFEPRAETRNAVAVANASTYSAVSSITLAASSLSRQGSGQFAIVASACPKISDSTGVLLFTLYRDSTALPAIRKAGPSAASSTHTPGAIQWIDVPGDGAAHVYSLVITTTAGTLADESGHVSMTVHEL